MKKNKLTQFGTTFKKYWINRKYKDRLFCKVFENKKDLLELYNAINNTSYTNLEDAIDRAINECVEEGVLVDILFNNRTLAKNTLLTEYDEKKRRMLDRKEGYEDGVEYGIIQSILTILRERGNISNELEEKIKSETDTKVLYSWLIQASKVDNVDEFYKQMELR